MMIFVRIICSREESRAFPEVNLLCYTSSNFFQSLTSFDQDLRNAPVASLLHPFNCR